MNCKLTDFADYTDLVSYIKCRDNQGGTPQHCLSVGDNGVGASGKTTATDTVAMCALPANDIRAKWGSTTAGWGKHVNVTHGSKTITVELADISPDGVCDLNPCALKLMGEKHPFSGTGSWEWADVIAPPSPAPPPPKTTQFYAIYSESSLITFADAQRIAAACHAQASGELLKVWGKHVSVEAAANATAVPLGHFRVIIKDDIGDGALGYHTDENGQPVCYIKAEAVEDTCITCSHEILEASVDSFGNRFIVIDLPPYGKVRCLVEIADPPESFAYVVGQGLPVSDFITPEWYDEVATSGTRYSYKGHITTPQTILEGGYISFMLADGRWMQRTWFSGDAPIDEGPFNWSRQGKESLREMVDRETRARRPA